MDGTDPSLSALEPGAGLSLEAPIGDILDPAVRARVTVGPPGAWVIPGELDESAPRVGTDSYTNLLVDIQHHAARHERHVRSVYRLESLKAVREASQWRLDFDPKTQRVVLHSLAIRRDGELIEQADLQRARFLQRETGLERFTLDGDVTLMLLLEDVRRGDILDASFTVQTQPRFLAHRHWLYERISAAHSFRAYRLSVVFPEEFGMAWRAHDAAFAPIATAHPDGTRWSWSVEKATAREPEPKTPPWFVRDRWVQCSNCASWSEVAEAFLHAWEEEWDSPELQRAADEIAKATPSIASRARRAIDLVQDDLRYLSVNIEMGGQIPCAPGEVLRRRYGDCKDKSFLLAHLLRKLGLSARPVLVNTELRQALASWLPMPGGFNHAIVEYELEGRRLWVDGTLTGQGGPALERTVPDFRLGLPLGPGVSALERVAPNQAGASHYEVRETFLIDSTDRPTHLSVLLTVRGMAADALRHRLLMEGSDRVAKERAEMYRSLYRDARRLGSMEWRDDRRRNQIVLGDAFELSQAVMPVDGGRAAVFHCCAHTILAALSLPDELKREAPLALPYACRIDHYLEIVAPDLPRMEAGRTQFVDPAFSFGFQPKQTRGRWLLHYQLQTAADHIPAAQYSRHRRNLEKLWPCLTMRFLLPGGAAKPWRPRANRGLLPPASAALESVPPPPVNGALLPTEPAAVLGSLPGAGVAETTMPSGVLPVVAPASRAIEVSPPRRSIEISSERSVSAAPRKRGRRKESIVPLIVVAVLIVKVIGWTIWAVLRAYGW
jgi:hypothetical protein